METKFLSIDGSDLSIKGSFLITSVKRKKAINNTPYYCIRLNHKIGNLWAIRFTNDENEFDILKPIYLKGNFIEIEGVYQSKFNSIKIKNEELIFSFNESDQLINQCKYFENILKKELAPLKEETELGTNIQIKSYLNEVVKPIYDKQSKRKIRLHKKNLQKEIEAWPKEKREEFKNYYNQTFERYESMKPSKLKKLGSFFFKLISILR